MFCDGDGDGGTTDVLGCGSCAHAVSDCSDIRARLFVALLSDLLTLCAVSESSDSNLRMRVLHAALCGCCARASRCAMHPGQLGVYPCVIKSRLHILKLRTSDGSSPPSACGIFGILLTPPSTIGMNSCSDEGWGGSGASSSQGVPRNFKALLSNLSLIGRRLMVRHL